MNLIVAANENWVIGKGGNLLYSLPDDLKYFKETTLNKVVVMGSKTYLSLPIRPLKNRTNIVVAYEGNFEGATTVHNFEELRVELLKHNQDDIFVIGGGSIYSSLLRYCKKAYVTKIFKKDEGDTYFPNLDAMPNWHLTNQGNTQNQNGIDFAFCIYENSDVETIENLAKPNKYADMENLMWKAIGKDVQIILTDGSQINGWVAYRRTEWDNRQRDKQGLSIIIENKDEQEIEVFAEDIEKLIVDVWGEETWILTK